MAKRKSHKPGRRDLELGSICSATKFTNWNDLLGCFNSFGIEYNIILTETDRITLETKLTCFS